MTTENSITCIHVQQDEERNHRKQTVNTRLFIDQLINCASLKQVINLKKPRKSMIVC